MCYRSVIIRQAISGFEDLFLHCSTLDYSGFLEEKLVGTLTKMMSSWRHKKVIVAQKELSTISAQHEGELGSWFPREVGVEEETDREEENQGWLLLTDFSGTRKKALEMGVLKDMI